MAGRELRIGQLWKQNGSGETYIVTKVYSEALSTYATLRKVDSEEQRIRVKVVRTPEGQSLPGFTIAQGPDEF